MSNSSESFLADNSLWYEDALLTCAARDLEFYRRIRDTLCTETTTDFNNPRRKPVVKEVRDFTQYQHNVLYYAIRDYNNSMLQLIEQFPNQPFVPISTPILERMLKSYAAAAKYITETEITPCLDHYDRVCALIPDATLVSPIIIMHIASWLKTRRLIIAAHSVSEMQSNGGASLINQTLNNLNLTIEKVEHILSPKRDEETMFDFGAGIDSGYTPIERFESGFKTLDKKMGGGFGRGEGTLIIAGTGVGKTVVACQLAMQFVLGGRRGLLITTEQRHNKLEFRIISNYCRMEFSRLKDGFNATTLEHSAAIRYGELRDHMKGKLSILNWGSDGGAIVENLPAEIDKFTKRNGPLDFIILDWIGGGLGGVDTSRPEIIRLLYQNTADYMADLADKLGIVTISFVQAHPSKAYNKLRIDHDCIGECKTVARKMYSVLGLTGMLNIQNEAKMTEADLDKPQFKPDQFIYLAKAREGEGGLIRVRRNFAFQRLEER